MGEKSKIEWTDSTWNPATGCTKVSEGCRNCYIERTLPRFGRDPWKVTLHPERLRIPLRWKKPRRIFISLTDLFHKDIPDDFIDKVWGTMSLSPRHTYQILTKRPERMLKLIPKLAERNRPPDGSHWPMPNVWLGTSVENQETADERIPLLLQTPAAVRFVSYEPALGPVDLTLDCIERDTWYHNPKSSHPCDYACKGFEIKGGLDWIIVGGESGPDARPMHPDWARSARDQCQAAGVSFFFKQWGEWVPVVKEGNEWRGQNNDLYVEQRIDGFVRPGKRAAGRLLDGRTWDEYPDGKEHDEQSGSSNR